MSNRKTLIALLLVVVVLAVLTSLLLLRSFELATAVYVVGSALILLIIEPFLGLVYYLAIFYIRPQSFVPGLAQLHLALVTGVAAFGSMLVRLAIRERSFLVIRAPQDYFLVWLFVAAVFANLVHLDISGAAAAGERFMKIVILYFLITNLVTTERRLKIIVHLLVLLTLFLAVQGIVQHLTGSGLAGQEMKAGRIRGLGTFSGPNEFALYLLAPLPFLYLLFVRAENRLARLYAAGAVVLIVTAIYLTNSRGAMLALGAMTGLIAVKRYGPAIGAAIGAMLLAAIVLFGPSRMATISTEEGSARAHMYLWGVALDTFQSNPVFGIGPGAWVETTQSMVAHNSFLQCAAEVGIFGLLPWILLILVSLKNNWFVAHNSDEYGWTSLGGYAWALFFAIVAWAFAGIFIAKAYDTLLFVLIALSTAVSNMVVDRSEVKLQRLGPRDVVHGLLVMVAGLGAFKIFLMVVGR